MSLIESAMQRRSEEQLQSVQELRPGPGRPRAGMDAPEVKCSQCGKRTRNKVGTCGPCQRSGVVSLGRYSAEQIIALMDRCRAELKVRQDRIAAALGEATC